MSNSATTAAKRRRTGPPMMQNTSVGPAPSTAGPITRQRPPTVSSREAEPVVNSSRKPVDTTPSAKPLTLIQVIGHIDARLIALESKVMNMNDTMIKVEPTSVAPTTVSEPAITDEVLNSLVRLDEIDGIVQETLSTHVTEFDHRYQMLAGEIAELKLMFMKLQTYTLDINKTLFEERVQILSELGNGNGTGTRAVQDQSVMTETEAETEEPRRVVEGPVAENMLTTHDNIPDLNDPSTDNTSGEPIFDINALIAQSQ